MPSTLGLVLKVKKFIRLTVHMTLFFSFLSVHVCVGLRSTPDIHMGMSDKLILNVHKNEEGVYAEARMAFFPTGSTLPDCSHACGPCFPCKRVMVSYQCAVAESCPIVYRCMCKGRYYHVPSN